MVSNKQKQTMDDLVDDLREFWEQNIAKHMKSNSNTRFSKNLSTIRNAFSKDDFHTAEQLAEEIHSWACQKSDYCEGTPIGWDYFPVMEKSGAVEYFAVDTSPHIEHILKTIRRDATGLILTSDKMASFLRDYSQEEHLFDEIPDDIRRRAKSASDIYNAILAPASDVINNIPDDPEDKVYSIKTILEKANTDMRKAIDVVDVFVEFCLKYKDDKPRSLEPDAHKMQTTLEEFYATVEKMYSETKRLPEKLQRHLAA